MPPARFQTSPNPSVTPNGVEAAHDIPLALRVVVLRDETTHRDPPVHAHVAQRGVQHRAAHVLEVDVDAVREAPAQRGGQVGFLLVFEGVVVPEPCLEELDLLLDPRAADDVAPGELGELADQLAHHAPGGGDEDRLTLLRGADLLEPDVRGEPRHPRFTGSCR
jgi:hypothetical protein